MNAHQREKIFAKTDKAYDFLSKREIDRKAFSVKELASYTGWKEQSARKYLSKKQE